MVYCPHCKDKDDSRCKKNEDDVVEKDNNGNTIDITDNMLKYVSSKELLKDVYCGDVSKSTQAIRIFFHELKATFVCLIGGIRKEARQFVINNYFSLIEQMKSNILHDLKLIEEDKI